jgi:hypothetical protein
VYFVDLIADLKTKRQQMLDCPIGRLSGQSASEGRRNHRRLANFSREQQSSAKKFYGIGVSF